MHRFFIPVVAAAMASTTAFADDHVRLRGTYALTGKSLCIRDPAALGFNPNFTPKGGPLKLFSFTVQGVMVLHADGTGTMNVQDFTVDTGGGETGVTSYQFTYTISADERVSLKLVPGTYSHTILTGPIAGLTQVSDVADVSGLIGEGARTITVAQPAPVVLMVSRSDGNQYAQICNGSRTFVRIGGADR
ncbi:MULTISPECIES: hypothetical protein [unclassified Bradyrhizobium]|uniref:hypothetical protein n=1 Tax=unclassified Bradyrhizobium TaxID=2631580 RepID=UPI0028E75B60|nr:MULTISPECIES: hypothetical protein [unclassified Bradyrhizobium]